MAASSSSSWKDPVCPICLEPVKQEAYLEHCLHSFCYHCIIHWSRVVSNKHSGTLSSIKCPLCKTENFSIIHSFNGESFQRHYINKAHGKGFLSSANDFRLQWYNNKAGIANKIFDVRQYWKCRKYLCKSTWLQSWLKREIQALTQEEDVDIIVHHIYGVVESFLGRQERQDLKDIEPEDKRKEFRGLVYDAARPFLLGQTEQFVDEVEMFLVSGLNIEAYDNVCIQYLLGSSTSA